MTCACDLPHRAASGVNVLPQNTITRIGRDKDGTWVGVVVIPVGAHFVTVEERIDEKPIERHVYAVASRALRERFGNAESGFFLTDAVKRAWNNVKLAAKSVISSEARKKLIHKLAQGVKKTLATAKKVYESPIFAGVISATAMLVPGAQPAVTVAYLASRAALSTAEGVIRGDPQARRDAAALVWQAAKGSAPAQAALKELQSAYRSASANLAGGLGINLPSAGPSASFSMPQGVSFPSF